jgi:hypothetical protein
MTWLLDLFCYVVRNEHVNKMGIKNCAIVMGPNLCSIDEGRSPMQVGGSIFLNHVFHFFVKKHKTPQKKQLCPCVFLI